MAEWPANDVTAFVLAGGKSSRMGRDKAMLPWKNETLLTRTRKVAEEVAETVRIVGQMEKLSRFGQVVEDTFRECGPLGGIQAALASSSTELNLVLAVDMPFLKADFLEYLILAARESQAMVTVPRTHGRSQTLCAVYRKEFGELATKSLRDGKNKIDSLFASVRLRVIEEEELVRVGFSADIFRNLNTPEDLKNAERVGQK